MFSSFYSILSDNVVPDENIEEKIETSPTVVNYMGAPNYKLSPLNQLRMLVTCWFLGEPTYYVPSGDEKKDSKQLRRVGYGYNTKNIDTNELEKLYMLQYLVGNSTMETFYKCTNEALNEEFECVLELAAIARNEYNMRSGPCALLVLAAMHPKRTEFNKNNPKKFRQYAEKIIKIPTDAWSIFEIWTKINNNINYNINKKDKKRGFPTILKKCISQYLESTGVYQLKKYQTRSNIVDLIRITHPRSRKNEPLSEMVKTGTVEVADDEQTWEKLRSEGNDWVNIIRILKRLPHMALLRNLRGIGKEVPDAKYMEDVVVPMLKSGVKGGKQFPFRYMSAYEEVNSTSADIDPSVRQILTNGIQQCIDIAMDNFPKLEGRTMCLSDNSGSAWGTFPSQYGKQTVAKIANLSSVMTVMNSKKGGVVGVFGDRLELYPIDKVKKNKNRKILEKTEQVHKLGKTVGGCTENGIWLFFKQAIEEANNLSQSKTYWFDNIFIYSDMQCGHGGLYGSNQDEYKQFCCKKNPRYINVLKLIQEYRKLVNPKVNVYCVQVAAYNNSLIPEMLYRTHLLSGWTGSEVVYAQEMNRIMDEIDASN